jgi:hypothetical protein
MEGGRNIERPPLLPPNAEPNGLLLASSLLMLCPNHSSHPPHLFLQVLAALGRPPVDNERVVPRDVRSASSHKPKKEGGCHIL